jgi:2-phosphosulfolactate phosphatase
VILAPGIPAETELGGRACVVVDVLRATTTLTAALEAGAKAIYPLAEPDDAWRLQAQLGGEALLGGERGGLRIGGFDLGNSPREYTRAVVSGKLLCYTTSNGTAALLAAHRAGAAPIYLGALRNATAVARRLVREGRSAVIYCSGSGGRIALEDVVAAGAIAGACQGAGDVVLHDTAAIALATFRWALPDLVEILSRARHGEDLIALGLAEDIAYSAQVGASRMVGQFDGVMVRPAGHILRREVPG